MAIELTLSNEGALDFQPGLPADYTGEVLQGAFAVAARTSTADIIVQEIANEAYAIRLSIGRFFKKVKGIGDIKTQGLYSYFMLKGDVRKEISSIGKMHVRQDQYTCFYSGPAPCKAVFEKNIEYKAIDFYYSPVLLQELLPFFPELNKAMSAPPGISLSDKTCWALPSMREIINQLINCRYDESTRQFYFDLKVREMLYQILEQAYKRKTTLRNFTPWEAAKIHQAKNILHDAITKKPPSIKSLSRQVALNEFKLKTGFRQYFHVGIFEWLLDNKMQHAMELILTTNKPIKEISAMVGYPLTTNFITAFRRKFGITPGSLRRK